MTDDEALAVLDAAAKNARLEVQLAVSHVRDRLQDAIPGGRTLQALLDDAAARHEHVVLCTDPTCTQHHPQPQEGDAIAVMDESAELDLDAAT